MMTTHQPIDFYGCNVFHRAPVKATRNDHALCARVRGNRVLMEANSRGHLLRLRFRSNHHQLPVVVTENGIAKADTLSLDGKVHDTTRVNFLNTHLL